MIDRIIKALLRCKLFAVSIFLTYLVSSSVGVIMAHAGNRFALAQRDRSRSEGPYFRQGIHRLSVRQPCHRVGL